MVCRRIAGHAVDEPQASREYCDAGIIALDRTSAATRAGPGRLAAPSIRLKMFGAGVSGHDLGDQSIAA
jgi:hypothetical protein